MVLSVVQELASSNLSHVFDQSIVNPDFIGLLPRFYVLDFQITTKINANIIQNSSDDAYKLLTGDYNSPPLQLIAKNCTLAVLEEFNEFLNYYRDTDFVVKIYMPRLLQGAAVLDGSPSINLVLDANCNQVNAAALATSSLCSHMLANDIHEQQRLLLFFIKLPNILHKAYLPPIFNGIINIIAGFMLSLGDPTQIDSASLCSVVEGYLIEYDDVLR